MFDGWKVALGAAMVVGLVGVARAGMFSDEERADVVRYWSEPGRYTVSTPKEAAKLGEWQVRLTPDGSQWLWKYNQARGLGKTPPAQTPPPKPDQVVWDQWIDARVAWDRFEAWNEAVSKNLAQGYALGSYPDLLPEKPGDAPAGLLDLVGAPPKFASAVRPLWHEIRFDDGQVVGYSDNPNMRARYAYYRFPDGVMSAGTPVRTLPQEELDDLFEAAHVTDQEQRVMKAVSLLEGGFDSVNTYDTGFVSVGFIQFACLREGGGSLGGVLLRLKSENPEAFQTTFRRFGIDVTPEGLLAAVDPQTGDEAEGPAAAAKIIAKKPLIAVFQRAGQKSRPFRVAQIEVARDRYLPTHDPVVFTVGDRQIACTVADIVKSDAGLATLMDRKVNTGKLDPLAEVVADIFATNKLSKPEELAKYERDLVAAIRFRKDYLADASLVQPGPAADPQRNYNPASRRGSRGGQPRP
ncbi:MAG: hypothetical protein M9921_15225 [Fimbriimonadaceae bacterium]|nr:hypothetical protein [Chthonomonadaceae bacterium]MCO5298199.1 hypothetical protein [Fimbriimonadaceae bacterium]